MKAKVVTMKPEVFTSAEASVILKAPQKAAVQVALSKTLLTPLQAKRKLRAQRRLKRRS